MKQMIWIFGVVILIATSAYLMEPSFNGSTPGCDGSGCHSLSEGVVSALPTGNLQIQIQVHGVPAGEKVAGEIVDASGSVVDFVNKTSSNPFTLTAPAAGVYRVNAGFKNPSRKWDSTMVNLTTTGLNSDPTGKTRLRFELFPNHPNPFNNSTLIRFRLPNAGRVRVTIYDINARIIRQFPAEYYSAGIQQVRWDGKDSHGRSTASGIYLYEVKSGTYRMVRRMILMK